MDTPIPPIQLPPCGDCTAEAEWLEAALLNWLNTEYLPEAVNLVIAQRAAQVYRRQRLEGEHDLGGILLALVTELQEFDFSQSFYSEFAVANAVSDLLLRRLGIEPCCGVG
ncbi:hypothetical protein NK55_09030 [Thermosynechococcus sp. NK55a]|jgi:hypothetical protein|uniref:hypothetical protein n=1 Tax=unclassified Thermosynechococcus TaxID=2622553 RepID=UPI0003D927B3|nr:MULTISPECIES: hypothetical protein [unclassified Thermosynechococcus]AHB89070.1 hypothetical protein NK55_09030 [Thermosynechococcus sp. NK55a]RMH65535.1 MAG: hypothetical protein D6676_07300 [Cyanobacteria bacterium J003]HIK22159.1 hypothetical protein [Thermosynechococcus sp. M3746_W2019_013]